MSQEEIPSVFVSKKVMCHLLIYKRNIENILKRAILNYFWLMLQYLFSCIREDFFVEKKCIFHYRKDLFLLFVHCPRSRPLTSNRMFGHPTWPVPTVPCMTVLLLLLLLHSFRPRPVLLTHKGIWITAPTRVCV